MSVVVPNTEAGTTTMSSPAAITGRFDPAPSSARNWESSEVADPSGAAACSPPQPIIHSRPASHAFRIEPSSRLPGSAGGAPARGSVEWDAGAGLSAGNLAWAGSNLDSEQPGRSGRRRGHELAGPARDPEDALLRIDPQRGGEHRAVHHEEVVHPVVAERAVHHRRPRVSAHG